MARSDVIPSRHQTNLTGVCSGKNPSMLLFTEQGEPFWSVRTPDPTVIIKTKRFKKPTSEMKIQAQRWYLQYKLFFDN